ncbi:MAG: hypothetical protein ACTHKG_04910 [Nocardioides sp.]
MTPPTGPTPPPLTEQDLRRSLHQTVPDVPASRRRGGTTGLAERARERAGRIRRRRRGALGVVSTAALVVAVAVGVPTLLSDRIPGVGGPAGPAVSIAPSAGAPSAGTPEEHGWCRENPCTPAEVVAGIRKPLDLPTLAPGEACPVSPTRRFAAAAGFTGAFDAVGSGPVYFASSSADVHMTPAKDRAGPESGWLEQKVIWVVDRSYVGGLLLRGSRIDGPGELRFLHYLGAVGYTDGAGDGKRHPELAYARGGLSRAGADSVSSYPSAIFVDEPGCYAVQVDGVGFSETLVFRALAP